VIVYFSSRTRWNDAEQLSIGTTGSASHRLSLDGRSFFNTVASGTANWQTETTAWPDAITYSDPVQAKADYRAVCGAGTAALGSSGTRSGGLYIGVNRSYITVRGFCMDNPNYGIVFDGGSGSHNQQNVNNITVEYNIVDSPLLANASQGIYSGNDTVGCHDWTVRRNAVFNSIAEAIYMGEFDFFQGQTTNNNSQCTSPGPCTDGFTNTLVEYNAVIDDGQTDGSHEGDVDIKPGNLGAIVRYNFIASTGAGGVLGGVVAAAENMQIYGNIMLNLRSTHGAADGGHGIEASTDGSDNVTHNTTSMLIANNIMVGNAENCMIFFCTKTGGSFTGIKVLNNACTTSGLQGLSGSVSGGNTMTFASIKNNIFSQNTGNELSVPGTATAIDYNVIYHPAGSPFLSYGGSNRTYAQWQVLGWDAHGANANPLLSGTYHVTAGSPAYQTGTTLLEFLVDRIGLTRSAPWWIGAYQP
jgi:hypothetical protein